MVALDKSKVKNNEKKKPFNSTTSPVAEALKFFERKNRLEDSKLKLIQNLTLQLEESVAMAKPKQNKSAVSKVKNEDKEPSKNFNNINKKVPRRNLNENESADISVINDKKTRKRKLPPVPKIVPEKMRKVDRTKSNKTNDNTKNSRHDFQESKSDDSDGGFAEPKSVIEARFRKYLKSAAYKKTIRALKKKPELYRMLKDADRTPKFPFEIPLPLSDDETEDIIEKYIRNRSKLNSGNFNEAKSSNSHFHLADKGCSDAEQHLSLSNKREEDANNNKSVSVSSRKEAAKNKNVQIATNKTKSSVGQNPVCSRSEEFQELSNSGKTKRKESLERRAKQNRSLLGPIPASLLTDNFKLIDKSNKKIKQQSPVVKLARRTRTLDVSKETSADTKNGAMSFLKKIAEAKKKSSAKNEKNKKNSASKKVEDRAQTVDKECEKIKSTGETKSDDSKNPVSTTCVDSPVSSKSEKGKKKKMTKSVNMDISRRSFERRVKGKSMDFGPVPRHLIMDITSPGGKVKKNLSMCKPINKTPKIETYSKKTQKSICRPIVKPPKNRVLAAIKSQQRTITADITQAQDMNASSTTNTTLETSSFRRRRVRQLYSDEAFLNSPLYYGMIFDR